MAEPQPALDALGDGTRRQVLELLRDGPRTVGDLADRLPVSRPAVSKHLRVLLDAGLVSVEQQGTRRLHAVDPDGLLALRSWLDRFWDDALDAFTGLAERTAPTTDTDHRKDT